MSDTLEVKIGASDAGLEATLKTVQAEFSRLDEKVKAGDLSFKEVDKTMKQMAQVNDLEKKLRAIGDESSGTSPKVDELGRDLEKMGNRGNDAGEKSSMSLGKIGLAAGVAGVAVKAGMLAVDAAFAAVNGAINAFGSAITKAADFQQLETSFNVLIGNTTLAKTFLQDLSNFAASTPFTIPGLADASKTLISFGVVSSDVIPIVSMLGDVAQGNEEKLKSLALAFGKVESQGKLTGEELNQMIDSGFNPLENIAEKTGKSMGELRKEMEKGAITSGMVRDAFTAATSEGGKFFGMTEKQGLTFNGVMSTMQDAVDDLYRRFGSPLIDALTPIIQKWSERISSIAPLFSEIGQAVANTVTFFSNLVDKAFNVDNAVNNISKSLSAISGGEYSAGIENLFLSMKVWAMESANEIYKNLVASFKTATEFGKSIFDPSGAFGKTVIDSFEYIGTKASVAIMRTLAKGFSGSVITEGLALSLNTAANDANISANKISESFKGAGSKIAEQFIAAGKALPESFATNYADVQPLFTDIKATQDQIDANNAKIAASTQVITKSGEEAVAEAKAYFEQWEKSEDIKQQAIVKELEAKKIKQESLDFDLQIVQAKASGNTELAASLESQKEFNAELKKAIDAGMGEPEAKAFAQAMLNAKNAANSIANRAVVVTVTTKVDDTRWKDLLASLAANAEPKSVEIAMKVTGKDTLNEAYKTLQDMETINKNHQAAFTVIGAKSVEEVLSNLRGIPTESQRQLAIQITGEKEFDKAVENLDRFTATKEAKLLLTSQGFEKMDDFQNQLDGITGEKRTKLILEALNIDSVEEAKSALDAIIANNGKSVSVTANVDSTAAMASISSLYDSANTTFANPLSLNLEGDQSIAAVRASAESNFAGPIPLNLDGDRAIQDVRAAAEANFSNPITLSMSGSQAANDTYETVKNAFTAPVELGVNADTSTAQTDVSSLSAPQTFTLSADTTAAQSQVAGLGGPQTFTLSADTAGAQAQVASLGSAQTATIGADTTDAQTQVANLGSSQTATISADSADAQAEVASLGSAQTATISADTTDAEAQVASLGSAITIPTSADTTAAEESIAGIDTARTLDLNADSSIAGIGTALDALTEPIVLQFDTSDINRAIAEAQSEMSASFTGGEGGPGGFGGDGGAGGEGGQGGDASIGTLQNIVETIKTILEKIEPKLPTAALAA